MHIHTHKFIHIHMTIFFLLFWNPQASAPITSGTHIDGGTVIRKPGSAWLEGTLAMDHGMNGKRIHMQAGFDALNSRGGLPARAGQHKPVDLFCAGKGVPYRRVFWPFSWQ